MMKVINVSFELILLKRTLEERRFEEADEFDEDDDDDAGERKRDT